MCEYSNDTEWVFWLRNVIRAHCARLEYCRDVCRDELQRQGCGVSEIEASVEELEQFMCMELTRLANRYLEEDDEIYDIPQSLNLAIKIVQEKYQFQLSPQEPQDPIPELYNHYVHPFPPVPYTNPPQNQTNSQPQRTRIQQVRSSEKSGGNGIKFFNMTEKVRVAQKFCRGLGQRFRNIIDTTTNYLEDARVKFENESGETVRKLKSQIVNVSDYEPLVFDQVGGTGTILREEINKSFESPVENTKTHKLESRILNFYTENIEVDRSESVTHICLKSEESYGIATCSKVITPRREIALQIPQPEICESAPRIHSKLGIMIHASNARKQRVRQEKVRKISGKTVSWETVERDFEESNVLDNPGVETVNVRVHKFGAQLSAEYISKSKYFSLILKARPPREKPP